MHDRVINVTEERMSMSEMMIDAGIEVAAQGTRGSSVTIDERRTAHAENSPTLDLIWLFTEREKLNSMLNVNCARISRRDSAQNSLKRRRNSEH